MARLADFIRQNTENILQEWETFARTLPSAESMDIIELRDHAKAMLLVIAADLDLPQTARQQANKAKGKVAKTGVRTSPTAAQEHGAGRAESGFSVEHMVAEFRALRASVIQLWTSEQKSVGAEELEDMTRFNEAIDQAIAESISRFTNDVGQSKERFLAILGHDLRTPLSAILTSSVFMLDTGELQEPYRTLVAGMASSARRMNQMVDDLLDFTRTRFGDSIPIVRADADLRKIIHGVVSEVGASYPKSTFQIETTGDLHGCWDESRLSQALTNLLANAVQHGDHKSPIRVIAKSTDEEVTISIQSHGPVIPRRDLSRIFEAMTGVSGQPRDRRHLGLGLYIVEKIVTAHGGSTTVQSSRDRGTIFTVKLPRKGLV